MDRERHQRLAAKLYAEAAVRSLEWDHFAEARMRLRGALAAIDEIEALRNQPQTPIENQTRTLPGH